MCGSEVKFTGACMSERVVEDFCGLLSSLILDGLIVDAAKFDSEEPDATVGELDISGGFAVVARGETSGSNWLPPSSGSCTASCDGDAQLQILSSAA